MKNVLKKGSTPTSTLATRKDIMSPKTAKAKTKKKMKIDFAAFPFSFEQMLPITDLVDPISQVIVASLNRGDCDVTSDVQFSADGSIMFKIKFKPEGGRN